jgi:hypothetical protein
MYNCCKNNTGFGDSYYKHMNMELLRRRDRDVEMMRELFEMLPIETQQRLKDEDWFMNKIKKWNCDEGNW